MLLKEFYSISVKERNGNDSLDATVALNNEHPVYRGHFPGNPVTPGVAMLQIIKELTEDNFNVSYVIRSVSQLKFLELVNPEKTHELIFHLTFQKDNDMLRVKNKTTFTNGVVVLKCNVIFAGKRMGKTS